MRYFSSKREENFEQKVEEPTRYISAKREFPKLQETWGEGSFQAGNGNETGKRVRYGLETRFRSYCHVSRNRNVAVRPEMRFQAVQATFPSFNVLFFNLF